MSKPISQSGYGETNQQPLDPKADAANQFVNYRFSEDELRVIKECEKASLVERSIPLGIGLGLTAYIGIKNGFLKASPRFGAAPKIIGSVIFGYIAGKFSYQSKCVEKLMALPNSQFAEMLRQKKHNNKSGSWNSGIYDTINADTGVKTALSLAPFRSASEQYSDEQPDALNLDTSRPDYNSLNDTYQPTMEGTNNLDADLNIPAAKADVSYEELRQRNREEFERKQQIRPQSILKAPVAPQRQSNYDQNPIDLRARGNQNIGEDRVPSGPRNKYGDAWSQ